MALYLAPFSHLPLTVQMLFPFMHGRVSSEPIQTTRSQPNPMLRKLLNPPLHRQVDQFLTIEVIEQGRISLMEPKT